MTLIISVAVIAHLSTETGKVYMSLFSFSVAFIVSILMHKHFFPFVSLSLLFFLAAITQELYHASYTTTTLHNVLWTVGSILLALGFLELLIKFYRDGINEKR